MAVETGMEQQLSKQQNGSSLTEEQKEALRRARRPVNMANGFRVFFAITSLLVLIIIYLIGKFKAEASWFPVVNQLFFEILLWDILFMIVATIVKFVFVVKYNKLVKKL